MKLSVIIPSYKDPLLNKTIESLLLNAEGEIEIIPVLDGYIPEATLPNDSRVKPLYLEKNKGMRGAIKDGVSTAEGEYIMKCDAHCMFDKGFDIKILADIEEYWVV